MVLGAHGVLTVEEARRRARAALGQVAAGFDPAVPRDEERRSISVAEFSERYLKQHAEVRKKPSSVRNDRLMLRLHILPRLGKLPLDTVTRSEVAALHHALRATPTTGNRVASLLSKIFNLAERWGLRPDGSNPCRHLERYRENVRRRFLSREETGRLGDALDSVVRDGSETREVAAAIRLLLLTGARVGEILSLRWEYVDTETRCLRLPDSKTGAKEIALGRSAFDLLMNLERSESGYVIPGRDDDAPLVNLNKAWRRIRDRAGLHDVLLHDLRRTAASAGASIGLSLETVGQLLGHTQVATTKRYAFLFDDAKREAAEKLTDRLASDLGRAPAVQRGLKGRRTDPDRVRERPSGESKEPMEKQSIAGSRCRPGGRPKSRSTARFASPNPIVSNAY